VQVNVKQINQSASEGTARDHKTIMDRPVAKGGGNLGAMGGEQLLMGLGGCFMSTLLAAAKSREIEVVGVELEISGTIDGNPSRFTAIDMNITAEQNDREEVEKLLVIAERGCIAANTLKNSVDLSIELA
jgi:putative redox protein